MPGTLPVSGNIDAKSFPFLVMDLHRHGATGSLKVDGPAYQKALYFRAGRILFGSSNDPRDQLGAILIDAGKLTPEQLEEVNAKVGPGSPLAKVLADSGLVTQQELSDAARAKVERILGDILGYGEGSFEFEDGVLPKGAVDLKLQTERLVLGAVKQFADRAFVLGHLGSLAVVLTPSPEMGSHAADIRTETGGLVDQFDGRRTLKEAVGQTQVEEFDAAKIACALLFLGLLAPTSQDAEAPETPSAPPAEEAPFFVADSEPPPAQEADAAFDLGATARMAFADDSPSPEVAPASQEPTLPDSSPPAAMSVDTGLAFAEEPEPPPAAPPAAFAPAPPPTNEEAPTLVPTPEPQGEELPFSFTQPAPPAPPAEPPPPISSPSPSFVPAVPTAEPAEPDAPAPSAPASPYPSIEPPSETDLKELDTLLRPNRSGPPPPTSVPPIPSRGNYRDVPRFVPQGSGARARAAGASKALIFLGALVVLAAIGGGAIWYLGLFGLRGAGTTTPAPVASPTTLPPPTLATQPAPEATVAALPPAATPATPAPTPQTPPVQPTPAPAPPPQVAPPPAGASPSELLRAGRLAESASASVARLRGQGASHTVQILVACSEETVHKAVANVSSAELFIVPVEHKGRHCYRMCWGVYGTPAAAAEADRRLPPYFRQGGARPRVVLVTAVLP